LYNRLEDEAALKAKVDEAVSVYEAYVKSGEGEQKEAAAAPAEQSNGTEAKEEEKKEETPAETKA